VRYKIDDDDEDESIEDERKKTPEEEVEKAQEDTSKDDGQLPETIFEELPNGEATAFEQEDTTVLFLAPDKIEVRAGPSDDYLSVLLDGGDNSNHEENESLKEEDEGDKEKSKKKKKKKKTYDSDESLDEDG